ncbi:MAG: hypothetical protein ABSF35_04355 [Polyangia bacterium]
MRHIVPGAVLALCASAFLSLGCGSGAAPSANSLTKVYTEVIQPTCTSDFCHYNGVGIRFGALDMSSQVRTFWSLVGQPCNGASCMNMGTRVVPGQPDISIMYLKISQPTPPCGSQMPADTGYFLTSGGTAQFSGTAVPEDQQNLIRAWIQEGAQDN